MTSVAKRAAEFLSIRPGEGALVALMCLHSFFVGMTIVFLETPASSLFLTHFDVDTLPYIFMATAAASVLLGLLITALQQRFEPLRFFLGLLTALALGTLAFYLALAEAMSRGLVLALMIWKDVVWTLMIIEFWAVAGILLHVRQGKRLFGLLNSGKILAGLLSGLATPLLVSELGALHVLALSLVGLAGSIVTLGVLLRYSAAAGTGGGAYLEGKREGQSAGGNGFKTLLQSRFLLFFFSVTVLSNLVFYCLEYIFYHQIESRYSGENEIASFIGLYIGVAQGLNLLTSALLTGRLLTRFGLSVGLLSVPVLLTGGLSAALLSFTPGLEVRFFWCIIASHLVQEVVGSAMQVPASRILYQPLGPRERLRVQTVRESIFEPVTAGVAGLLLLLLPIVLGVDTKGLLFIVTGLLGLWLILALGLRAEYTRELTRALKRRRFRHFDLSLEDASSLVVLERELENPRPGAIIYCLETLAELKHPALERFLLTLLDHPSEVVRKYVVGQIEERHVPSAAGRVAERIELEEDPEVRGAALRAFCALTDEGGIDRVLRFLDAEDPELRQGAVIGLLRSGGIEGVLAAGARLNRMIESEDAKERLFAAQALGEVGISSFYRPLVLLLEDAEMRVRREALKSAGKLRSPGLIRSLIRNLEVPAVADAAVASLMAYGEAPLPELEEAFRRPETAVTVRSRIVRIAGNVGGEGALTFLKAWLDHPQEDLRYDVLRALSRCGYRASGDELEKVRRLVLFEAADATWTLATLIDLGEENATSAIGAALEREITKNTRRILLLLSFLYTPEDVLEAKSRLESDAAVDRARALEVLDNLLDLEMKGAILPLVDDLSPRARLSQLERRFAQERLGREGRLRELITRTSDKSTAWTKACAIHVVGKSRLGELEEAVVLALADENPFIRETAVWALSQVRPESLLTHLPGLIEDPAESVAKLARWLLEAQSPLKVFGGVGYLARSAGYRVDFLEGLLTHAEQPFGVRIRAARILGSLRDPKARRALHKGLSSTSGPLRTGILRALGRQSILDRGDSDLWRREKKLLERAFEAELERAERLSSWLGDFPVGKLFRHLRDALRGELGGSREQLLRTVVLLSPDLNFPILERAYLKDGGGNDAVPIAVSKAFTDALSALAQDGQLDAATRFFESGRIESEPDQEGSRKPPLSEVLREIVCEPWVRPWTKACSLEMLGRLGLPEGAPAVAGTLDDPDEIVRETAWWALAKLDPEAFRAERQKRGEDRSPRLARFLRDLLESRDKI